LILIDSPVPSRHDGDRLVWPVVPL